MKNSQELDEKPPTGNLRGRSWKRFVRGPDPELREELYVPALSEAVRYDRCCAYFSSSVMAAAARGFGKLIARLISIGKQAPRPAVRLVVNEELSREDVRALLETGETAKLEELLTRRFGNPKELLEKKRLAMLGWLAKKRYLDIRVGVMRRGEGIVHGKFGIITDEANNAVVFCGSGNESAKGLVANYERLEISTSWGDPDRHREYAEEFDALWGDKHPDVHTVTLPEALRLKLIKFAPEEAPVEEPTDALGRQRAAMIWRFIAEAPYLPNGAAACDATAMVELWPHQRRVVDETAAAWPSGRLLCDEVGLGKTIEAIFVLRRLMAGRGVRRALLLLPKNLITQWQEELREKGGMEFPRLEGLQRLVWPDRTDKRVSGLAEALKQDVLLMSRETARTESNMAILLAAEPWDLVLLDEAHAARRRQQVEGEFNSGVLLLNLIRQLQLRRKAKGFLLLSATPMQTHPWEPWDLMSVLGVGGAWLSEFSGIRDYYGAVAALKDGRCTLDVARRAAVLVAGDPDFPEPPNDKVKTGDAGSIAQALAFAPQRERDEWVKWLRRGSPLARHMHRNNRDTLRAYHQMGVLKDSPPIRTVDDICFDFAAPAERQVYDAITDYIERRFEVLEQEKPGKGFVMTVYRRRGVSSFSALERSLEKRKKGLQRVAQGHTFDSVLPDEDAPEGLDPDDMPQGEESGKVSSAFPEDPNTARQELAEVEQLLDKLHSLRVHDSKLDRFADILGKVSDDERPVLVFTDYLDTLKYLRDGLTTRYGAGVGCYSGDGGQTWDGESWQNVTKDAITRRLHEGKLRILICTDAASEGLNLQAAGALINYDLPWSPSRVEQRIGRIDRIGQRYPIVRVVNLFLKDSVDEQVYTVLRARCGLFEHFVGPMQPVLARARQMLMGQEAVNPKDLEASAAELERDPLPAELYLGASAEEPAEVQPPVTGAEAESALLELGGESGISVKKSKADGLIDLSGLSARKVRMAPNVELLEHHEKARPLSPLCEEVRQLADKLSRTGERLPLVVGSHQKGSFRASVTCWAEKGHVTSVTSLSELRKRMDSWDGVPPSPEDWQKAVEGARKKARTIVLDMAHRAEEECQLALARQLDAARLRLLRELGRYLMCFGGTTDDPNQRLYEQMTRDTASSERLQKCRDRLGGKYPDWPAELRRELEGFAKTLTPAQRKARYAGSEIDAALDDPRWAAGG